MYMQIATHWRHVAVAGTISLLTGCAVMDNLMSSPVVRLSATMSGAEEVPPAITSATGTVTASFNKNTNRLSYEVNYSGLTGPATAGHFHGPAAIGQNAGVVVPFPNATSPIRAEATLTQAQAADLLAGRWYANIHTARYPGGEIRGQLRTR